MSHRRALKDRLSFSPALLVLLFSTALLLVAGCPQPVPGPTDDANTGGNSDIDQDPGNPDDGYQAPDPDDPAAPDGDSPDDPGDIDDQDGDTDPGDSTGGDPDDGDTGPDDDPPTPVATNGDMNADGNVDAGDIRGFILALLDLDGYKAAYPTGNPKMADANGDGRVNSFDIDAFRTLVLGQ